MQSESNTKRQIVVTLVVLVLISAVIVGVALTRGGNDESSTSTQTTSQAADDTTTESTDSATASTATYKDGEYTATGDYSSPGGAEEITVTVTLKDGAVTATSAEGGATSGEAEEYQSDFIGAFADMVVGKNISNLELDRVAGASLTANGFNDAIEQIKDQAAA